MRRWLWVPSAVLSVSLTLSWAPCARAGQPAVQRPSSAPPAATAVMQALAPEPAAPNPAEPQPEVGSALVEQPDSPPAEQVEPVPEQPMPAELLPEQAEQPMPEEAAGVGPAEKDAAPSSELPSYTAAAEPSESGLDPGRDAVENKGLEVPPDGRGMLSMGSLLLGGGVVLTVGGPVMASQGYSDDLWQMSLGVGVMSMVAGSVLLVAGSRRLRKYRNWEQGRTEETPRRGTGLTGAGVTMLGGGALAAMYGGFTAVSGVQDSSFNLTLIGLGLGGIAVGAALTAVGVQRNKRFRAWRAEADQSQVQIQPSFSPLPGGAQLGLHGRF